MKKRTSTLFRRGTAYLLALMLCVSTVQVTAFADGDTPPEENASAPTVVQPDEPQSAPEPSTYNAEASSSSKEEVNVTLKEDGSLEVGNYPSPKEDGSETKYEGEIKDKDDNLINQPASSTESGSSSAAPAKLEGIITETSSKPAEEDKGEGTEGQPAEGEEPKDKVISEGEITGKEETDVMDRTDTIPEEERPQGGDTEHENAVVKNPGDDGFNNTANATLTQKVDKDGKPVIDENGNPVYEGTGSSTKTEITVDEKNKKAEEILEKEYGELKAPDGYTSEENSNVYTKEDKENGITLTWEKKDTKDQNERFSYETIETETKVVTQENLPAPSMAPALEEKPATNTENGITVTDSEDGIGYTVEKTTKDEEGNVVTTETQVVTPGEGGAYTVVKTTTNADGKETTETVTVNADGSYTISKTYPGENGETITETKNVFDGKMTVKTTTVTTTVTKHTIDYDKNNDTTGDTKGSVSVGVTVTEGDGHGALKTEGLQPDIVDSVTYTVTAAKGVNVRKKPNTTADISTALPYGTKIQVTERIEADGYVWGKIGTNKWIALSKSITSQTSPGLLDPADNKTDTYTDLYGWLNQVIKGRPNDTYNTSGSSLYFIESGTNQIAYNSTGQFNLSTPKDGLVYVQKWITVNGKEYGVVGNTKYAEILIQKDKLKDLTDVKADEGKFLFYGQYGLSSAVGVDLKDKTDEDSHYNVHQFVIKDEYGRDHYVYCSDLSVHPVSGTNYGMTNVEDADYLEENADIIKAIATNGYWGTISDTGSMESFKQWLKNSGYVTDVNDLNWLTPGLAMSVTQAAIWHFGNSKNAGTERELDEETPFEKDKYGNIVTDSEMKSLDNLYKFLTNPENAKELTKDAAESTKLLNANSVQNVSVTVTKNPSTSTVAEPNQTTESKETYGADISFTLDVTPGTLFQDMCITLKGSDGNNYGTFYLDGTSKTDQVIKKITKSDKDETYTIRVSDLPGGVNLTLKLSGTQEIKKGAYLISAQGGFDKSQTFISVESGKRSYDLNMAINLSVESAQATVTTTTTPEVTKTEQINREWSWETKTTQTIVEPDKPDEPTNPPTTPETPRTPDPGNTPDPDPDPDPEIPDEPVPLTYIPDEPVPQAPLPPEDLIDIFDGDVPLASPYGTGDNSTVWYLIAVISVAGLLGLRLLERKANGENAK